MQCKNCSGPYFNTNIFTFFRFYWKIVQSGNESVAFIGINVPGTMNANLLLDYQKQACLLPLLNIFNPPANLNQYYIKDKAYPNGYGNIFACALTYVLLPEMVHVKKTYAIPDALLLAR